MPDNRILDRARLGQELEELQAEQQGDMYEGAISPREVSEFQAVTEAIKAVLEEAEVGRMSQELTPGLHAVVGNSKVEHALALLAPAQRDAVERLLTAATAHDADRGTYVSALERNTLLNQALMYLQPLLATALRPDFRDGRRVYQDLVAQLNDVRRDIMSGILSQGTEIAEPSLEVEITEGGDEDEPGGGPLADPDLGPDPGADLEQGGDQDLGPDPGALSDPELGPEPGSESGALSEPTLDPSLGANSGAKVDPLRKRRGQDRGP
jgi:hypothetical protein